MKSANIFFDRSFGYWRGTVMLLCGLVLLLWPEFVKRYIIVMIGVVILLLGIISLIVSNTERMGRREKSPLMLVNSVVDILFGATLLIFPGFFANLIVFVFGIFLMIFGIGQLLVLFRASGLVNIKWTMAIVPAVTAVAGLLFFFYPNSGGNGLFQIFGVVLTVNAVFELISTYQLNRKFDRYNKEIDNI